MLGTLSRGVVGRVFISFVSGHKTPPEVRSVGNKMLVQQTSRSTLHRPPLNTLGVIFVADQYS